MALASPRMALLSPRALPSPRVRASNEVKRAVMKVPVNEAPVLYLSFVNTQQTGLGAPQ